MSVEYREYIQSKEWKAKAKAAKRRVNYCCKKCGNLKPEHLLHAHHLIYERLARSARGTLWYFARTAMPGSMGKSRRVP